MLKLYKSKKIFAVLSAIILCFTLMSSCDLLENASPDVGSNNDLLKTDDADIIANNENPKGASEPQQIINTVFAEWLTDYTVDFQDDYFRVYFGFKDEHSQYIIFSGTAEIMVVNDLDETVFHNLFAVTTDMFSTYTKGLSDAEYLLCEINIPVSDIEYAKTGKGTFYLQYYNENGDIHFTDVTANVFDLPLLGNKKRVVEIGSTFIYDDFEITFGNELKWDKVVSRTSQYNGSTVFGVSVTVKNLKSESDYLGGFGITGYNPNGNSLDRVAYLFKDDIRDSTYQMRSGASTDAYMYFLYDGDGDYYIELKYSWDNYEIKIPVKMPTTEEIIIGKWIEDGVVARIYIFKNDGTYEYYTTVLTEIATEETGTYTVSGENIIIQSSSRELALKIVEFKDNHNTLIVDMAGATNNLTFRKQ